MNNQLIKRFETIKNELIRSKNSFATISNFVKSLSEELYLINYSLQDQCTAISRSMADSWLCQVENQLERNQKLCNVVNKLIYAALNDENLSALQKYVDLIAEVDASILDGFIEGKSNRPVDGLMPCVMPDDLQNQVTKFELNHLKLPTNWMEWRLRVSDHIDIVNEFVKLFPASHSFASLPYSISIILTQIHRNITEQNKLENMLEILTSGQDENDYSSIFGMDVILIKQQLKPIPTIKEEEE